MSGGRGSRPRRGRNAGRLLRWYPRSWRREHGAVLLGTWQDVLQARGDTDLTRGEAWSMRVHGLAERLDLTAAVRLAVAGVVCTVLGLLGAFGLLAGATVPGADAWAVVAQASSAGAGPALVSMCAVALLRHGGVLGAPGAVVAGSLSVVAWAVAAVSALSWGVGFDRADAGLPATTFSSAFPVLLASAVLVGAAAATPVWEALLARVQHRWLRRLVAAACAVPTALALGLTALGPGVWPVVAIVLLVVSHVLRSRDLAGPAVAAPTPPPPPLPPLTVPPRAGARAVPPAARRRIAVLSGVSAVLGTAFTAQALVGAPLTTAYAGLTGLPALNAGMAGGALAAVPLTVAAGSWATHRWGRPLNGSAALIVVALVLTCASRLQGPDGPFGLLLAAAVLTAAGFVLPFRTRLPGRGWTRWGLAGLVCLAGGWTVTLPLVLVLPLATPVLAVLLLVRGARPAAHWVDAAAR